MAALIKENKKKERENVEKVKRLGWVLGFIVGIILALLLKGAL